MLWSKVTDSRRLPLTEQVVTRIGVVEHALQTAFEQLTASPDIAKRPLCFDPVNIEGVKLVPADHPEELVRLLHEEARVI